MSLGERESKNEGVKNKRERRDVKYHPDLIIRSKKKNILLSGSCMPSKPFNPPKYPEEIEAHTGHVSCSKITLPQSGRTKTSASTRPTKMS